MRRIVAQAIRRRATCAARRRENEAMTPIARFALPALLLALAATTTHAQPANAPAASAPTDDKRQALAEFIGAYRLAEVWPQMAPKIARDSLPRLEDATHADLDHDKFATPALAEAAHARVPALLAQGRRDLQSALQRFDADELAAYTAYEIYSKYFETAEIRQITAFFGSPTGRKLSALGPTLVAESRQPVKGDPLDRHFDEQERAEILAFWQSPLGAKMNATAEQIREDMHAHFIERSEASVQEVARQLASKAEAGDEAPKP